MTKVDNFWSNFTVKHGNKLFYQSIQESDHALIEREKPYLLARELVGPYQTYENVLDYGCGPGHDVIGFLKNTSTKKIFAFDISQKALQILKHRLSLYGNDFTKKVKIMQGSDGNATIPIKHDTIDHINCIGVLQHCSFPQEIIDEFYRILKPNGTVTIMVYNRDSIYFHLYAAYYNRFVKKVYSNLSAEKTFSLLTDSNKCPLSNLYTKDEFIELCPDFEVEYKGGYFLKKEIQLFTRTKHLALKNKRLEQEHKDFLENVNIKDGYPTYNGYYCGVGGVYHLIKRSEI
jgi:ubiquinone/menaquinone biosynthesis C-methylase UbiE